MWQNDALKSFYFIPLRLFDFLCDFALKNLTKIQTVIYKDSVYCHKAWIDNGLGKLKFPLLSDITKEISRAYNVLMEDKGIALRGTFIIDTEGVVASSVVNITKVGRSVDETLRTLQALQTGELVPCDWKPGQKTLGK
jgi:alkyl hydroperoxide reductase subunit AhpC